MPYGLLSCGSDEKDEPSENFKYRILGDWYHNPDGWKISFNESDCVTTMWNGRTRTYNYTLNGNQLEIENYANISGRIIYMDETIMRIQLAGMSDIESKRQPDAGWNDGGSNDNDGGSENNDSGSNDNESGSSTSQYTNYIHYRYYQTTNYYHEISLVKQEVELSYFGTIHGWNYKYLNFYIGDSRKKVGFQFESTYYEDEYPPTTPWPAMDYDITSKSGSAISHFLIARVFLCMMRI